MSLQLLRFFHDQAAGPKIAILLSSLGAGLSRGLLLVVVNTAAEITTDNSAIALGSTFVALLFVHLGLSYFSLSRIRMLVEEMTQRLRLRIVNKLLLTQLSFIEDQGSAFIYARLTQDIGHLSGAGVTLVNALEAATLLLFTLAYIGWLSPLALLVTLLTICAGVATYLFQDKTATSNTRHVRVKEVEFFGAIGDVLDGFKELKINRAKNRAMRVQIHNVADVFRQLSVHTEKLFTLSFLTSQAFIFVLIGVLVFIVPTFYPSQEGLLFQFLAAILFLTGPLELVVTSIPGFTRANVALENVSSMEEAIDRTIAKAEDRRSQVSPLTFERIDLRAIGYHFSGSHSDDDFILGPLDLRVNRGEVLFIVGGNGSGKTTLIKIITGLYLPGHGDIYIDDTPLSVGRYQAYREMFTTIFGDFHLFQHLYGIAEIDQQLLAALLQQMELDKKTHFENGAFSSLSLSTGQRKRLAYIVSYLENKQIYVFDEFAADQDPYFRRLFYETLLPDLKKRGKTVIAITHDDKYFHACDRLVKIDEGRIVHDGAPGNGLSRELNS